MRECVRCCRRILATQERRRRVRFRRSSGDSSSQRYLRTHGRYCEYYYVFFFQAEDGIRDYKVTGVQTCALPISVPTFTLAPCRTLMSASTPALGAGTSTVTLSVSSTTSDSSAFTESPTFLFHLPKIGRASCRERV